jgi:nucleotide-binding universal stress UspA family protein
VFKTIVVGLDGSVQQPKVIEQAVELADRCGGKLHLVRAVQIPPEMPVAVWAKQRDEFEQFLLEHAQADLRKVEQRLPPDLVEHRWAEMGKPADVLCRLADDVRADLIVIGSQGYRRLERMLGTTAAKVVNHASCTVVVVR